MEYGIQYCEYMFGSASTTVTLTADFADNRKILHVAGMHSAVMYVWYTPKTGQTDRYIYMKVEMSGDNARWVQLTKQTDVSGDDSEIERFLYTDKLMGATGGVEYSPRFAIGDIADKYVRISFKEDGSDNFGTVAAEIAYTGR